MNIFVLLEFFHAITNWRTEFILLEHHAKGAISMCEIPFAASTAGKRNIKIKNYHRICHLHGGAGMIGE
eukprot:2227451-Karenia_brevis.AAC.1